MANWQKWCVLCAECDADDFIPRPKVEKFFSVTLPRLPMRVCTKCYEFIQQVQHFDERRQKAEELFKKVLVSSKREQKNVNYLKELRRQAGVNDEEDLVKRYGLKELRVRLGNRNDSSPLPNKTKETQPEDERRPKRNCRKSTNVAMEQEPTVEEQIVDNVDSNSSDHEEISSDEENSDDFDDDDAENDPSYDFAWSKCPLCDKHFNISRLCYEHLQKKHPECKKPFSCAKCPKRFANDCSLKKHQRTHLPRSLQTLLRCAHCKKTFHSNNSLNIHIRAVHEKELPFICQDCGKGFFSSHVLKEHQVIHSDDLPFACTVCQKRFKLERRLKFHMETHSDQTFDCPKCDAKLSSSHVLRQHMVVHSDERKYSCEICGKAFKRQHDCKIHSIIHTGQKPFKCIWCEKTFASGNNLRHHKTRNHPTELRALEASLVIEAPPAASPNLRVVRARPIVLSELNEHNELIL